MDSRHGGRAVQAKDSYVYELLTDFRKGRDAFVAGVDDACVPLRQKCYSAAKKPVVGTGAPAAAAARPPRPSRY